MSKEVELEALVGKLQKRVAKLKVRKFGDSERISALLRELEKAYAFVPPSPKIVGMVAFEGSLYFNTGGGIYAISHNPAHSEANEYGFRAIKVFDLGNLKDG